jgi:hypothetical protein
MPTAKPAPIIERSFDQAMPLTPAGIPAPHIFDASPRANRQRAVSFATKRYVDMMFVTGLDRATADRHISLRAIADRATPPAGLAPPPPGPAPMPELADAWREGRVVVTHDDADRHIIVTWTDGDFGPPVTAHAIARPGYGGILLGADPAPRFDAVPIARIAAPTYEWDRAAPSPALEAAADRFFAASHGLYGVLIATPDRILLERHSAFGRPDRVTVSWSMNKSMTTTTIGRLIHEGWLNSVTDPAPAPLWADPRAIQSQITLDDLMRMRAGLAMPVTGVAGVTYGYEAGLVYSDAHDAFDFAQRSIVVTRPGAAFRYSNAGMNVLGAVIRRTIERRGLPYHATLYALLADRLGMSSFQYSADIAGNLIASGAAFATQRDYAKLGLLYLKDGVWNGERLLPTGWVDWALTVNHAGTTYAAGFRVNDDATFPSLPRNTAWAAGAGDQRIVILRDAGMVAVVTNEADHPIDLAAMDRMLAAAVG